MRHIRNVPYTQNARRGVHFMVVANRIREQHVPHITFVDYKGERRTVEVAEGLSVMEGALRHRIPGIEGDCGGACACATCHIHVDPAWLPQLPQASELETAMLTLANDVDEFSRLACQIKVTQALDGLVVSTPESQY